MPFYKSSGMATTIGLKCIYIIMYGMMVYIMVDYTGLIYPVLGVFHLSVLESA